MRALSSCMLNMHHCNAGSCPVPNPKIRCLLEISTSSSVKVCLSESGYRNTGKWISQFSHWARGSPISCLHSPLTSSVTPCSLWQFVPWLVHNLYQSTAFLQVLASVQKAQMWGTGQSDTRSTIAGWAQCEPHENPIADWSILHIHFLKNVARTLKIVVLM